MKELSELKDVVLNWKASPSSFGVLVLPEGGLTVPQERDLAYALSRPKPTDNQLNLIADLTAKKNAIPQLTEGAKTKLREIFVTLETSLKREIKSKHLEKGIACEPDGLKMLQRTLEPHMMAVSDGQLYEDDFLIGTPDKKVGKIVYDIKNTWDFMTLENAELSKIYDWQGICYLELLKNNKIEVDTFRLFYSLNTMPPYLMAKEFDIHYFQNPQYVTKDNPEYIQWCKDFEEAHTFDAIPDHKRFRMWETKYNPANTIRIQNTVIACREYLTQLLQEKAERYIGNVELIKKAYESPVK